MENAHQITAMILLISVAGQRAVWLSADRRLSQDGVPVKGDACKVMWLDTRDGQSILAYAGLGATGSGAELSEWMSRVLRGRDLPLGESLTALAEAMEQSSSATHGRCAAEAPSRSRVGPWQFDGAFVHRPSVGRSEIQGDGRQARKKNSGKPPIVKLEGSGARHVGSAQRVAINKLMRAHERGDATDQEYHEILRKPTKPWRRSSRPLAQHASSPHASRGEEDR